MINHTKKLNWKEMNMKGLFLIILGCILVPSVVLAGSFESSNYYQSFMELPQEQRTEEKKNEFMEMYLVEQKVKDIPFRLGDTMDTYLSKRASIPIAEDMGWEVRRKDDGYEVERTLLMEGKDYLHYTWFVKDSGEVSPMNDRTKRLHKMAEKAKGQSQE